MNEIEVLKEKIVLLERIISAKDDEIRALKDTKTISITPAQYPPNPIYVNPPNNLPPPFYYPNQPWRNHEIWCSSSSAGKSVNMA